METCNGSQYRKAGSRHYWLNYHQAIALHEAQQLFECLFSALNLLEVWMPSWDYYGKVPRIWQMQQYQCLRNWNENGLQWKSIIVGYISRYLLIFIGIWKYYLISVPEAAAPSTRTFFWWNYGKKTNQLAVDIANLFYVYLFRFSIIMTMHDFPLKLGKGSCTKNCSKTLQIVTTL